MFAGLARPGDVHNETFLLGFGLFDLLFGFTLSFSLGFTLFFSFTLGFSLGLALLFGLAFSLSFGLLFSFSGSLLRCIGAARLFLSLLSSFFQLFGFSF